MRKQKINSPEPDLKKKKEAQSPNSPVHKQIPKQTIQTKNFDQNQRIIRYNPNKQQNNNNNKYVPQNWKSPKQLSPKNPIKYISTARVTKVNGFMTARSSSPQKQRGIYSEYVHPNNAQEVEKQKFKGVNYNTVFGLPKVDIMEQSKPTNTTTTNTNTKQNSPKIPQQKYMFSQNAQVSKVMYNPRRSIVSQKQHSSNSPSSIRRPGTSMKEIPTTAHTFSMRQTLPTLDSWRSISNIKSSQQLMSDHTQIARQEKGKEQNSSKFQVIQSLNDLNTGEYNQVQIENYIHSMQTIDPKVIEPYERFPDHIPRNVAIERKKKLYQNYDINKLLKQEKIDLNQIMNEEENSLALELFDDTNFDDYTNEQWIHQIDNSQSQKLLLGKAVYYDQNQNNYEYKEAIIYEYDPNFQKFKGKWICDKSQVFELERFFICFNAEDPRKYIKRIKSALEQRAFSDCLIRYHYIIDCMPLEDQASMDPAQSRRIEQMGNIQQKFESTSVNMFMAEVSIFYKRVMNKLCLDRFLLKESIKTNVLYPTDLIKQMKRIKRNIKKQNQLIQRKREYQRLKKKNGIFLQYQDQNNNNNNKEKQKDPFFKHNIQTVYQQFIFSTLYIEEAVITALLKIKETCLQAQNLRLFNLKFDQEVTLEQFIFLQECQLVSIMTFLTEQWVQTLAQHVLDSFEKVGKGWFNIQEQNKQSYEFGKLKKFLTLVRMIMEESVNHIVRQSYDELLDYIIPRIPKKVVLKSMKDVENSKCLNPLFKTEIQYIEKASNKIIYTESPEFAENILLEVFTKGLKEITKIPDISPLILKSSFQSAYGKQFINAPVLSQSKALGEKYEWLRVSISKLQHYIKLCVKPLKHYIQFHQKYKQILNYNSGAIRADIEKKDITTDLDSIVREFKETSNQMNDIEKEMPKQIQVGSFSIDQSQLKTTLVNKYEQIHLELRKFVSQKMRYLSAHLRQKIYIISENLNLKPRTIEEVITLQTFIESIPKQLLEIDPDQQLYFSCMKTLELIKFKPNYQESQDYWNIFGYKHKLALKIAQIKFNIANQTQMFKQDCIDETVEFTNKILQLKETIEFFKQFHELKDHEENVKVGNYIQGKFTQYLEQGSTLNKRQELFGIEVTNYSQIGDMNDDFEFFFEFWNSVSDWKLHKEKVLTQPLKTINSKETKKVLEQSYMQIRKCKKVFQRKGCVDLNEIVEEVLNDLNQFKEYLPIILALCKEGIRERHWIQFFNIMGFEEFNPQTLKKITFKKFADKNIIWYKDQILDISEKAFKEFSIEESIQKINHRWQNTKFNLIKHENTVIISDFDDKLDLMDEDIIKTQRLNFSIYKKPFEEQILNWNRNLKAMTEIIEEWQKFQEKWLYLQPLFESPDISDQLPLETKKFNTINSFWRHLMLTVRSTNNVSILCLQPGIQNRLSDGNKSLEAIQSELNNYLDKKCEAFGRFYFLSNNDLITILSLQKQPQLIQSHLNSVFENINRITFEDNHLITHIISQEQENIKLLEEVDCNDKLVENWLNQLEKSMQATVKKTLSDCYKDSLVMYFTDLMGFIRKHPGMHIITVTKLIQTFKIEEAFEQPNSIQFLQEYKHNLQKKILDILVENIRIEQNQMIKTTLNALIVSIVHNIEMAEQFTKHDQYYKQDFKNQNFDWLIQLRFYLNENEDKELECVTKCLQCELDYGYEYLGNTYRLVITPLTLKCWITMMQAIKYYYGGMAAGPAGSGKTETVKDLSKALAKQCVVFNCSDSMDYIVLAKFFKGLASSGAWCCFDEFNRMNIEVLSVIAQQLLILFRAKKIKSMDKLVFEGSEIQANYSFSVFVTMNPGYQGKVELPDNLKSIFRTCAMMIPNNDIITEIILYSQGFRQAKYLSQLIVSILTLIQEQLSAQPHYDFGLRCIKFIIKMADKFKNQQEQSEVTDEFEFFLIFKSISYVNMPKLVGEDKTIFQNILQDSFKQFNFELQDEDQDLKMRIQSTMEKQNYKIMDQQIYKILSLAQALKAIHGIMIIGETGSGKSTSIEVLQNVFTDKNSKVHSYYINPKSVEIGQLYGEYLDQWKDGVLTNIVRKCQVDKSKDVHWIIMDGPIDTFWIENINSVLDETKKLCLANSEILTFTNNMGMIFEIEDLENSSPAIVSRCLMIYMTQTNSKNYILWSTWLEKFSKAFKLQKIDSKINQMIQYYLPQCLEYIKESTDKIYSINEYTIIQNFLQIFSAFLLEFEHQQDIQDIEIEVLEDEMDLDKQQEGNAQNGNAQKEIDKIPPEAKEKAEKLSKNIELIFIQVLLWTFSTQLQINSKSSFDEFLKRLIKNDDNFKRKKILPQSDLLENHIFDTTTLKFQSLSEKNKKIVYNKTAYQEIFVYTEQSILIQSQIIKLSQKFKNTLLIGPSYTGKSKILQNLIEQELDPQQFGYQQQVFSGETNVSQLRDFLFQKLEKRRKKIYGPQLGKTHVFYIDDVSQPKQNEFFQQPTLELLREFLSYSGTYHLKDLEFIKFEDVLVIGSTSTIAKQSPRLISQFICLGSPQLTHNQIIHIFQTVLKTTISDFVRTQINQSKQLIHSLLFIAEVKDCIQGVIECTINILNTVKKNLFPSPTKLFYQFSLNDVCRILNVIRLTDKTFIDKIPIFLNLWVHENIRTYSDRLRLPQEKNLVDEICIDQLNLLCQKYKIDDIQQILNRKHLENESFIWTEFLEAEDEFSRIYKPISSIDNLVQKMNSLQIQYNLDSSIAISKKKNLNLIMFKDVVISIAKIARSIQIEQGHCLVIGTGGKGRSSLSRLGCYCANLKIFEAGYNQSYSEKLWKEELKKVLLAVSTQKQNIGFLISCKKITENLILNDINQILQTYELFNILSDKQLQDIYQSCQLECVKKGLQPTQKNIFMIHKSRIRQNFHVIVPMTPTKSDFSLRLREFKFFTNHCQIIYLNKWSDESLLSVSKTWIKENAQAEYLKIVNLQDEYIQASLEIHRTIEKIAHQQQIEQNRKIHIEPIQFIEFFTMFKNIAQKKQEYITQQIQRMQKGVITLRQGQEQVRILESELIVLQPQLQESKQQLSQLVEKIKSDQQYNEEKQLQVYKEQQEAIDQKKLATVFKKQAEDSVRESELSMKETLQNIKKLKKEHLTEIKSLTSPPQPVKVTIAGIVILFEEKIKKKGGALIMTAVDEDKNNNKVVKRQGKQSLKVEKEVNYFETAKRFLMNDQRDLLDSLMHYDTTQITEVQMIKLQSLVLSKPEFSMEAIKKVSHATKYLYLWIKCMVDYYNTQKETEPIRKKLDEMKILLKTSTQNLEKLKNELNEVQGNLDTLEKELLKSKEEQRILDAKISDVKLRHERAMQLTYGLEDEGIRWEKQYAELQQMYEFIPGNSFMVAFSLINFGPLGIKYRQQLTQKMIDILNEKNIKTNSERNLINFLADDAKIYSLYSLGVAKDENSTQNALMLEEIQKWPILIDPQQQGLNYLKNQSKGFIQIIWESDQNLQRCLELGVQSGQMIVVKTNQEEFHPLLTQFFDQSIEQCKKDKQMKFGDKSLTFNENFRFILCTNVGKPKYSPEIYVKLCVLNFSVSPQALEEQMLAQIILLENPYLEKKKSELMEEKAKAKVKLREIENVILKSLSEQTDVKNLLNDQQLVSQLSISKQVVKEIEQVLEQSEITSKEIDHSREDYRPLAIRANLLYLSIQDLSPLNTMYKYSLEWFQDLFAKGLKNVPIFKSFKERINYIIDSEMKMIYENVCMSLFQEDKLLFSFFIAIRLLREKQEFNQQEYQFLLKPLTISKSAEGKNQTIPEKFLSIIPDYWWKESYCQLQELKKIPNFETIEQDCSENYKEEFSEFFETHQPYLHDKFFEKIDRHKHPFQKLLIIKTFRPDKLPESILEFIKEQIGEYYITLPNANIETLFPNSTHKIPLIFILKQGIDPRESFMKFVDNSNMGRRHIIVSLGQGQGQKAEEKIRLAQKRGYWILLENCHLSLSWLPTLDNLTTYFDHQLQDTYRLWLTTMPTSHFPMEVLQNGIKMALYPPLGIKANLLNIYNNISDIDLNDCSHVEIYKKMVFSMSFLHSILQDRNRFGPIGWNVSYDFSNSDLNLCKMQIKDILELLESQQNIPFSILKYLIGQIHYDGIVTDSFDKTLLLVLINKFIGAPTIEQGYQFSEVPGYEQPKIGSHRHYLSVIQDYPHHTQPKLFGIHNNVDIQIGITRTNTILNCLDLSNPDSFSMDKNDTEKEENLQKLIVNIIQSMPQQFDLQEIKKRFQIEYNKSFNHVIIQETQRYSHLLTLINNCLNDIQLSLVGKQTMDIKLEQIILSLQKGKIPDYWNYYSFECEKPISSWLIELKERVEYFHSWVEKATPRIFWIGAFFNPRVFLVGIKIDYARNMGHNIDQIQFETLVTPVSLDLSHTLPDLKQGVYISGVYLEGGAWCTKTQQLVELPPLEMTQLLPVVQLKPTINQTKPRNTYQCPFYKTINRYGQLNSIGKSTNFIMYLYLNGNSQQNGEYWKQGGLAAFLNLNL